MDGMDQGSVFYSYQNREGGEAVDGASAVRSSDGGSMNSVECRRRFKAFLLGYHNTRSRYVYAEQLRKDIRVGIMKLEIAITDVANFDPPLALHLRTRPGEALPEMERAATEAAAVLQASTPEELINKSSSAGNAQAPELEPIENEGDNALPDAAGLVLGRVGIQVLIRIWEEARPIRQLTSVDIKKLITVYGIVVTASKVLCKSTAVRLKCRSCNDRVTIPVNRGFGGFTMPRRCRRGGDGEVGEACPLDPYVVVADESRYVDSQVLKLQEPPETVPNGETPRSITLSCERYMTDQVQPGARIKVLGLYTISNTNAPGSGGSDKRAPRSQSSASVTAKTPYLRVLGLEVTQAAGIAGTGHQLPTTMQEKSKMQSIAEMPDLYNVIGRSIAPEIYGHEDIKKAIACLLFAGALDKVLPDGMRLRGDINVLLLGDPSTAKSQMLKYAERASPISIYTSGKGSSGAGLTASVVKDSKRGLFHVEGGAMVLANGGVVCVDEFDKMRLQDRVSIHEAMEQQTVSVSKGGCAAVLNARTAVLAAANPAFGRYDETRSSAENIEFQSTILSRFDLIFIIRDKRDDARDRTIAEHVLSLHQRAKTQDYNANPSSEKKSEGVKLLTLGGKEIGPYLGIDTLKRYLSYARHTASPRLTERAMKILQENYISIREQLREKQLGDHSESSSHVVPITVRQLEALIRISEALAKMTLSREVSAAHALEAIRLFKVATLDSAMNGDIQSAEGSLRPDVREEVQRVEEDVRRRVAIGSTISKKRLITNLVEDKFSEFAARNALYVMLRRGDLQHRRDGRSVHRVQ